MASETHPNHACPECDDVQNECCDLCHGTDQICPVCECPADDCEYQEGIGADDPFYGLAEANNEP